MNKYEAALTSSITLIKQANISGIDVDFIMGVCAAVHTILDIQDSTQQFNSMAKVMYALYGAELGKKRFKKYLSSDHNHSSERCVSGYQYGLALKSIIYSIQEKAELENL